MRLGSFLATALLFALPLSAYAIDPVPEPSTMALFAAGIGAAIFLGARRKKR